MPHSKFKNLYCLILILLIAAACQSPQPLVQKKPTPVVQEQPVKPTLRQSLATFFKQSEVFNGMFTGFMLYDPATDEVIFAQNEKKYFTPASNTKLYTFYTGLKIIPEKLPALEYVIRGDSLIFWGTGDPIFLRSDLDDGTVYNFLKNSSKKLYYSDANFKSPAYASDWLLGYYLQGYTAERTPLPMYGNLIKFEIERTTQTQIASKNGEFKVYPSIFRELLSKPEHLYKADQRPIIYRGFTDNNFLYYPKKRTTTYTDEIPYHYTPQLITKMLSDTLNKPVEYIHIKVPDQTKTLYSATADSIYKAMLQPSDNFIAEQLLLVASSVLWKELSSERVIDYMEEHYLKNIPDEPQWLDGSGLSALNLFTPRSTVWLLRQIDKEFETDEALYNLLAAGGESGTLRNWYAARDGGPTYIYGKTGTVSNVHCVSGYLITESGHKLMFSFMNSHYMIPTSKLKEEMEKVFWLVHENY